MHPEQVEYCQKIKARFPEYFQNRMVLDVGSQDINGNNKYLFKNCNYLGLDIGPGKNVDIVCHIHCYPDDVLWNNKQPFPLPGQFDSIISTEMLEHDQYWYYSLQAMHDLLRPGGFLLVTAAGRNRPEHGTTRTSPKDSPYTTDYYRNITPDMIIRAIPQALGAEQFEIEEFNNGRDIGFFLIK